MTIVGGELDEIVDEFSDGRVSYGCNPSPSLVACVKDIDGCEQL